MGEKQLRDGLQSLKADLLAIHGYLLSQQYELATERAIKAGTLAIDLAENSDDPDLVGVLRWAYEDLEHTGGGGEEAVLRGVIELVEKDVELTETGWEWTEDTR